MSYLFIDCETGGLDPQQHSLLTLSCDLVENIGNDPVAQYSTQISTDIYHVHPNALSLNCINLIELYNKGVSIDQARNDFETWIKTLIDHGVSLPIHVVGWNVGFDLEFIFAHLFTRQKWASMGISYRKLDVCALVEFLIIQGKLPPQRRLVKVAQYFGLDISKAHDAMYDNFLCRKVLEKLLTL